MATVILHLIMCYFGCLMMSFEEMTRCVFEVPDLLNGADYAGSKGGWGLVLKRQACSKLYLKLDLICETLPQGHARRSCVLVCMPTNGMLVISSERIIDTDCPCQ